MKLEKSVNRTRRRRRFRVRKKLRGDPQRPRLSVYRSHKHVAGQLIDDEAGVTLASASTREKTLKDEISYGGNCAAAEIVGKVLAERALAAGIRQIRFDRGHYNYHGRVAALAEAARKAGLNF